MMKQQIINKIRQGISNNGDSVVNGDDHGGNNNNNNALKDDLKKPMRLLIYEKKYSLASLTVFMTALSFVMALSIREITSVCIKYFLLIDTDLYNSDTCLASFLSGTASFSLVLAISICTIEFYLTFTS